MKRQIVTAAIIALTAPLLAPARAATLFVSSAQTPAIFEVTPAGGVSTFQTTTALPANMKPTGIVFDTSGNFYVADIINSDILKITPAGVVTSYATLPPSSSPRGLAIDANNNIYAADINGGGEISKIDTSGNVTHFATLTGSAPTGLAFDSSGFLYSADLGTNKISKISSTGAVTPFATLPDFSNPEGLAFDAAGNLYVADSNSNLISKVTAAGTVSTFATLPSGHPAPEGLAFDPAGNLYVADNHTNQITRITPSGLTITTVAINIFDTFIAFAPGPFAPGDANGDGLFNIDDYLAIDNGYLNGLSGVANGDFNNSGTVDAADYAIIDSNFTDSPDIAPASPVPEPATLALLSLATAGLLRRRRRAALNGSPRQWPQRDAL